MVAVAERTRPLFFAARVRPTRFLAAAAVAPALLGIAWLLPEDGVGLILRLIGASACVLLLPGALVWRAIGGAPALALGLAAALAWSLTALALALAVTFAVDGSLALTLAILGGISAVALAGAIRPALASVRASGRPTAFALLGGGALLAWAVWYSADAIQGDALFHLGRTEKIDALGLESLESVGEFRDGGLHPGYAFPLWHGAMALVARLAGVDPAVVILREAAILTPLAIVVAYAAGAALFRSSAGGLATAVGQAALVGFERGGSGSFELLALPATSSRLLLTPALLALVFSFGARRSWAVLASIAAASLCLTAVHPTYTFFVALALGGFLVARVLLVRDGHAVALRVVGALAAVLVPAGLFVLWLWPIVTRTSGHSPDAAERRRAEAQYAKQIAGSGDSVYLAPELISRGGAPVVAALLAIPFAVLAARRGWAAFVLGGSLAVLAVALTPPLFSALADAASLSQARRIAGFLPLAFALAGLATVLARAKLLGCAVAVGSGVLLQWLYPAEYSYRLIKGGPGWVVWAAVAAGAVALVIGIFTRRPPLSVSNAWVVAVALAAVAPSAFDGLADLRSGARDPDALTPGLMQALHARVGPREVVFGNLEASYRIGAFLPVYVAANPPAHVADTPENRPHERVRDVRRFFGTGDLAIPRRYGASWLVIDRKRSHLQLRLRPVYSDSRSELYRLRRGTR